MNWHPHDLIWVRRTDLLATANGSNAELPHWVHGGQGPVVVRREHLSTGELLAVGVRGTDKSQRQAAYIPRCSITAGITPYELTASRPWLEHPQHSHHPVLLTLAQIAPVLDAKGLRWGITGSLGYEFASGECQLHPDSDLDLTISAALPIKRRSAAALLGALGKLSCRLDIQLETPAGAIALAEWAGSSKRVMIRTATGPRLSATPWQPEPD